MGWFLGLLLPKKATTFVLGVATLHNKKNSSMETPITKLGKRL